MRGKTQEQDVVFCISLWRVDGKEPALGALLPWTVPTLLLQWERAKNNSFVWKQQCERNHKIPPFFFFCSSIPSLYISLPSKLLNVGLRVEAAHLKQAKNTSERAGKTGERAPQRGLHFSQSRSALCTQPIFGAQWQSSRCLRTILSKIGPDSATAVEPRFPVPGGGEQCAFHCASVFSFFDRYEWKRSRGREQKWMEWLGGGLDMDCETIKPATQALFFIC